MAIDPHDEEAAAQALLSATEADTSPLAAWIDLLGLKMGLASCLLLAPVYFGLAFWWLDGQGAPRRRQMVSTSLANSLLAAVFCLLLLYSRERLPRLTRPRLMSSPSRSTAPTSKATIR
jgi:hypothetical protein